MQGSSDVLHGTIPPDKSSQQERILFSKDQLDSIVAKINCGVSEKPVSELNPALHISDPINLNPAQSSQVLKEVMEGEFNCSITSNPLGIGEFQPKNLKRHSNMSEEPLVLPPKLVIDCFDRSKSKDPFSFHKSLPLVIEELLEKSSTLRSPKLSLDSDMCISIDSDMSEEPLVLPPKPVTDCLDRPESKDLSSSHKSLPLVIEKLLEKSSTLQRPKLSFQISKASAIKNFQVLRDNNWNLEKVINSKEFSVTNYGSEFKVVDDLDPLLELHPRWKTLRHKLINGCNYPLKDLDESIRQLDIIEAKKYGNHKSASRHESFLSNAMAKEVKKGWVIILPDENIEDIPGLVLSPLGVAKHLGISEAGEYVEKLRVTHDLSWPGKVSKESVNSRMNMDELEPIMFGYCLPRLIHYICNLRKHFPSKKIWLQKEDLKSAYRRFHLAGLSCFLSAVRVKLDGEWFLLISLQLPFGGSSCPADFCLVSDIITDTINDLLLCKSWDESRVHSPFLHKIPNGNSVERSIPFGQARDLMVDIPIDVQGKCDSFIDDFITCAVDVGNNKERIMAAPSTVIHAMANSFTGDTHVDRDDILEEEKAIAEGAAEEIKTCLGLILDTRRLLVKLPHHKFTAWSSDLRKYIGRKTIGHADLKSLIGKLENVITVLKIMGHFMNNLYALEIKLSKNPQHNETIPLQVKEDFKLHLKFLSSVHEGISMNRLTFRRPDHFILGDACEHGLGAFHEASGRAFAWIIPPKLQGRAHINLLEFLTQVLKIWSDTIEGKIQKQDCVLAITDSTTTMGWLRRTNFREFKGTDKESDFDWYIKQQVARKLAEICEEFEIVLYSQWIAGVENVGSDSLSRDCLYLSPKSHENFLKHFAFSQVSSNLVIKPLPKKIVSFATSILQQLPVMPQRFQRPKPSELLHGVAGSLSLSLSALNREFSSTESPGSNRTYLYPPSLKPYEKQPSLEEIKTRWFKEQSGPPSHTFHRPSGQTLGLTPNWTSTVKPASC